MTPRQIPFFLPDIRQEEIDEVAASMRSGWLTTGPRVQQFATEFAHYVGRKHAVAVNSCTAALHLALEAIGVRPGDYVVVPTLTFAATAEVVRYFDANPLLVDCRASDYCIDVDDARRRIKDLLARSPNACIPAVIPVHYGGQVADVAGILALAREFGLEIVDDAAHCCPASYRHSGDSAWLPVGAESRVSCYSFYANKPITTGEGGMACTDDEAIAQRMRLMSLHGISNDAWKRFAISGSWNYDITAPGFKYNLTDVAASIGLHQLRRADEMHARRRELAALYHRLLASIDEVHTLNELPDRIHSWHLFPIQLNHLKLGISRDAFIDELKKRGIGTSVHWKPLHMHPYYVALYGFRPEDFPVAAGLFPNLITLPFFPRMSDEDVGYVCESIREIIAAHPR
jgi:dTDP-4-amino-4,6-dideoxygalactose transaminase